MYSPIFSQCTQEENDNIDVIWDWHSPQSKPRVHRQKRLNAQQSPKFLIKRQPSNSSINAFEKLKEDLETLRDEIINEHPHSNKRISKNHKINEIKNCMSSIPDLQNAFDDSMEEHLIVCSQEIEHNLDNYIKPLSSAGNHSHASPIENNTLIKEQHWDTMTAINIEENLLEELCENRHKVKNDTENRPFINLDKDSNEIADDSFDCILGSLKYEEPTTSKSIKNKTKTEFNSNQTHCEKDLKTKHNSSHMQHTEKEKDDSPIKCSPKKIEQKRLQALEKLESKKKLEIIERNRQQALKRLEMNRRKRALVISKKNA